ncbi:Hpt domain-containing protein [Methyloglobulus sp.]|uniref:response regulator n=1 Tax=Methyloglobulus sp. TaxID=2518622 RepID=UPI0032B7D8D3
MVIPSEEYGKFVTLLAYEDSAALQIQQLRNTDSNTLVLTSTPDDTSTAITSKQFNLIIVDMELNGFVLVSLAKTERCINRCTPIIALLDNADAMQNKKLIAAGFDDCLTKPLTADTLDEVIKLWRGEDVLTTPLDFIQALLAKCHNNNSLVLTLYQKLFEELPLQTSQIGEAIQKKQYKTAFELTHKLNGSAKICCLRHIEDSANSLETCLMLNNYVQADGYFLILKQRVADFFKHRQLILDHLEK